jgi:hypothetical protein
MSRLPVRARVGAAAFALLLAACTDQNPLAPAPAPGPNVLSALACAVDVQAGTMSCQRQDPVSGANLDVLYGGQENYVKLKSSGTSYDGGTEILQTNVTVQNLLHLPVGTPDGVTVGGVKVFFASGPTVTSGGVGAAVSIANEDGTGTFTAVGQDYFEYLEILEPLQISSSKTWMFNVTPTVTTFSFTVFISAPMTDPSGSVASKIDATWSGAASTDWSVAGNWQGGAVPDSTKGVAVPADSLFGGGMPTLTANADVAHLRVGFASSLGQAGFLMRVRGNVDAVGTISGGTLWMSGTGTLLSGNVGALQVSGSTELQGATKATGAVSVTGSLNTNGNALSISIP